MKYLKLYDNYKELDPFDEEDWDEEEIDSSIKNVNITKINETTLKDVNYLLVSGNIDKNYFLIYYNTLTEIFEIEKDELFMKNNSLSISNNDINDIYNDKENIIFFFLNKDTDKIDLLLVKFSELIKLTKSNKDDFGFINKI